MASWKDFEEAEPEMARNGRRLLYCFGPGLGFLATVRQDGGARIHPICPVQINGALYASIVKSPKRDDLLRNGHYALHSFPLPDSDDEFFLSGRARVIEDAEAKQLVSDATAAQGTTHGNNELLFEFDLESALHSAYERRGAWPPTYSKWLTARNR